jgi:hypothetical protein
MKNLLLLSLAVLALAGCVSPTRFSLPPGEAHYRFVIHHAQSQQQAFNNVELALAEEFDDLSAVLQLKQPETGTYLLKALVPYTMDGLNQNFARYTLKIVVQNTMITADFDLGTDDQYTNLYAPESEIPKIRDQFKDIAAKIASEVGGTLQ